MINMKKLIYIIAIFILFGTCVIGCKSVEYIPVETVKTVKEILRDTLIQTKLVVYHDTVSSADTISHLENIYAESWAKWSNGMLSHSLKIKDISIPVKATIKDTHEIDSIRVPYPVKGDTVYVEKKLSWWENLFVWTGGIAWIGGVILLVV